MKKIIYSTLWIIAVYSSCTGQVKKENKNEVTKTFHKDGANQPKADIKVNKHYDKNGNLVSFDSTYSSYYSTRKGDKKFMDSLFQEFKPAFNKEFPLMNDNYFNTLFYNDSLLYNDFFHDDFFRKRMDLNKKYMDMMMDQMDSVKNEYFRTKSRQLKK